MHSRPFAALVLLTASVAIAANRNPPPRRVASRLLQPAATGISGFSAAPGTVSFSATDPDLGTVTGSAVTLSWNTTGGSTSNTWTLKIKSNASTLTNCPNVPISAVTVACNSGSAGGSGTFICGGSTPLSTTNTQIASGRESSSSSAYTANLTFTFTDSWQYAATSSACSVSMTYTLAAP